MFTVPNMTQAPLIYPSQLKLNAWFSGTRIAFELSCLKFDPRLGEKNVRWLGRSQLVSHTYIGESFFLANAADTHQAHRIIAPYCIQIKRVSATVAKKNDRQVYIQYSKKSLNVTGVLKNPVFLNPAVLI